MKTLILRGIATFTVLSGPFAFATNSLYYDSRTEVGSRVVLEGPYLNIGGYMYPISSAETSGLCFAYGLGEKVWADVEGSKNARFAEFDKAGNLIRIGPYGSDSQVLTLICLKR